VERPDEIRACIVCVNVSCLMDGSQELVDALQKRLAGSGVDVKTEVCLGACGQGPNLVLYPRGTWLCPVQLRDVDDVVAGIQGGPMPERLLGHIDPDLQEMILSVLDAGME
jgi:NADP-reducing hydrogenase subunit HndC